MQDDSAYELQQRPAQYNEDSDKLFMNDQSQLEKTDDLDFEE